MSGFKDASLNNRIAIGILKHIIDKISVCCKIMVQDCNSKGIKVNNNENDIRDYLFCNYLNNDTVMKKIEFDDFRFFSETPENYVNYGALGRTDLQVISIDDFRHRERYFIIECKRIDGNLTLNRHYIDDGIRRFVGSPSKYTSYFKSNCMLGFIVKDIDVPTNVDKLKALLETDYRDIEAQGFLKTVKTEHETHNTYISIHALDKSTNITLFHAFIDCVPMIS
jgi:hypothetical protein